jgi:ketosteroid isomerase-like protein
MKSNKEIIEDMYAAFGKGDIPAVLDAMGDNFTWTDPCNPLIAPQGGTYSGRDGMTRFFENLGGSVDTTLFEVDNYLAAADTVAASGKHGVTVKATGKKCIVNWVMIWDFENGQPVKGRSAFDARTYELSFK